MRTLSPYLLPAAIGGVILFSTPPSFGQTPEQSQLWEAQRIQALSDEKLKGEKLERERQARKANPMGCGEYAGSYVRGRLGISGGG